MAQPETPEQPTFANGGIPLSSEGIRSQMRLHRIQFDSYAYPLLKSAEPTLDALTLELCAEQRSQGVKLEDWLLKAEVDAFMRIRARRQ